MTKTEAKRLVAQYEKEVGVESVNLIGFSEGDRIKYWGVSVRRFSGERIIWQEQDSRDTFDNRAASAPTAADIGRKGGAATTEAKRLAAAENGKKGGRPKKTTDQKLAL